MDTCVFIDDAEGIELINPDFPGLEGRSLIDLKDMTGKAVVRDEIAAVMKEGSAWVDLYRYKPGQNTPARKQTFVQKVRSGADTNMSLRRRLQGIRM